MNLTLSRALGVTSFAAALVAVVWSALSISALPTLSGVLAAAGASIALLLWPPEVPARAGWSLTVAALAAASGSAPEAILLLTVSHVCVTALRGFPPGGPLGVALDAAGTLTAGALALSAAALVPLPSSTAAVLAGLGFVALDRFTTVLTTLLVIDSAALPKLSTLFPAAAVAKGGVAVGGGVALGTAGLAGPVEAIVAAIGLGLIPQMAYRPVSDDAANPLVQFAASVSSMEYKHHVLDAAASTASDLLDCPTRIQQGGMPDESRGEVGTIIAENHWLLATPSHRGPNWRENAETTLQAIATISNPAYERADATRDLHARVHEDGLTGALNKAGLHIELQSALMSGERIAVLFIDLDKFKPVNDTYGHGVGDEILRQVTKRLSGRENDTVARYGGDEFVVVLRNVAAKANVEVIGQRLLAEMSKPFPVTNPKYGETPDEPHSIFVSIGASIGIALNRPEDTPDSILERSDEAMYDAKHGGRGRLVMSG